MRIIIAAVGRLKSGPEYELVAEYLARARGVGRQIGFTEVSLIEVEASKGGDILGRRRREGELLSEALPAGARIIALDERGEGLGSAAFAALLAKLRDEGVPAIAFLIGGADGLPDSARARAFKALSFGPATFPHLLVRAMLAEQIYRAMTILSGHPYHRA
ncbi:MAG: 23S rRNA (pseudouridine(1915)-N(3))-methyltransferase RlmH [Parvularculaceae bacterium]|jgi:23S rRNA (pseudouridine1915-N3)-methyltransferase|nr:23S rRNA (pseudouridine(1915)-N(3))-methyltransferase RlmH [Parvularculaceae bacterium]